MAYLFPAHPDDLAEIERLRQKLITIGNAAGRPVGDICEEAGLSREFISRMIKAKRDSPKISSLQQWAALLDHRIEFGIENFWLHAHGGQEMLVQFAMSRPWGADAHMRQWLVSALGQWRVKMRIDAEELAELMGIRAEAVRDWEVDAHDPVLKRAMWQARVMRTRVTLDLWRREDWVFGP